MPQKMHIPSQACLRGRAHSAAARFFFHSKKASSIWLMFEGGGGGFRSVLDPDIRGLSGGQRSYPEEFLEFPFRF